MVSVYDRRHGEGARHFAKVTQTQNHSDMRIRLTLTHTSLRQSHYQRAESGCVRSVDGWRPCSMGSHGPRARWADESILPVGGRIDIANCRAYLYRTRIPRRSSYCSGGVNSRVK
jgi:hypothetical protein